MDTLNFQAAGVSQTFDNSLAKKIEILVKEGVKNDSNLTDCTNRTFFPRPKAIHSHIVDTIRKLRHSKIYQEYLIKKIVKWEKDLPTPSIQAKQLFDSFIVFFRRGLIYLYTYLLKIYV